MTPRASRKLAVILHADVASSTALVQRHESIAHERMRDAFGRLSATVECYGGIAHEVRGDAVVVEFARVSDAVSAAVAFQTANAAYNRDLSGDIRPEIRTGISLGEVVIADGTVTGPGVVLAQRLEQLAAQGGVVVQGSAAETVPSRLPFEFDDLGAQRLKGFDQPVRAFAVRLRPGASAPEPDFPDASNEPGPPRRRPDPRPLELPDRPSIAVLPFSNMSDDPEQEYFSDGITEDITTGLSCFSGLFVIARNSAFTYKGLSVDVRQVARELGVRYVLEGSVRRLGDRVRISGQLIDAVSGSHIWAERFDADTEDIIALQDEVTRKIVSSIAPQIALAEVERGRGLPRANVSSYELSLKAKSQVYDAFRSGDAIALQAAIDAAREALEQDPRNTHALWILGVAQMDQYLYRWGRDPDAALSRAQQAAERLVRVDAFNADGYGLRGAVHTYRREFDLALADFARALSLNPNSVVNLFFAAWGESLAGATGMAREHAELGLRLSPREMDLWLAVAYLALTQASFAEGDFDEAMKWGRLAVQLHATAPIRRALLVACCACTGDLEGAARHAQELQAFAPEFVPAVVRGDMVLYRMPAHNELLVEGLRRAGLATDAQR